MCMYCCYVNIDMLFIAVTCVAVIVECLSIAIICVAIICIPQLQVALYVSLSYSCVYG